MFFCVCSSLKSLLSVNPFTRSPALSPTLYKFIVFGSLGSYPRSFGLGLQIVTLQLAPSVGKKSFQCETSKKNAKAPTGLALGLEAKNAPTIMFDLQYFFFYKSFWFFSQSIEFYAFLFTMFTHNNYYVYYHQIVFQQNNDNKQ